MILYLHKAYTLFSVHFWLTYCYINFINSSLLNLNLNFVRYQPPLDSHAAESGQLIDWFVKNVSKEMEISFTAFTPRTNCLLFASINQDRMCYLVSLVALFPCSLCCWECYFSFEEVR